LANSRTMDVEAKKHYEAGCQLLLFGSHSEARDEFLKALQISPDVPQIHLQLGQSFLSQKRPDVVQAAGAFHRVVDLSPDWSEGYHWLGTTQWELGNLQEAVGCFEKAIDLAPEDTRPRIMLGVCLTKLKDYPAAIIQLRKGISLKPHYALASAHLFLADALRQNAQIAEARKEWRLILEMPAEYPDDDNPQKEARQLLKKYGG
jgi:tetratricopeptide (TPR) repeat protein